MNQKKQINVSVSTKVTKWVNGVIGVKANTGVINLLIKQLVIISRLTSSRVRVIVCFTRALYRLQRHSGKTGLVKTLKSWQVCLMQSIGGQILEDLGQLGPRFSRTKGGLPRVIPVLDRQLIRDKHVPTIRFWMSMFSLYRLVEIPGKLKLRTITDPPKDFSLSPYQALSESFSRGFGLSLSLKPAKRFPIFSASSTQMYEKAKPSTGFRGVVQGALAIFSDVQLLEAYQLWVPVPMFNRLLTTVGLYCEDVRFDIESVVAGSLAFLSEPAGKIRVVAMVDCWTQWALRPLHDSIFEFLKGFGPDGTMDQMAPVRRLLEKGHKSFWCYDLSAATDRLPISIQVEILIPLIGKEKAFAWRDLLVKRDYVYVEPGVHKKENNSQSIRYATGQPMGALSSWAMLALTHHMLVALAALRVGFPVGTFTSYAVLGDDIVLANGQVARSYLNLMREIGVGIGIAKSLVSRRGVLEFAKRFLVDGHDCSAVSLREVLTSMFHFQSKLELGKKYFLSLPQLLTVSGWGFRAKAALMKHPLLQSHRVRNLGLMYFSPWGVVPLHDQDWFNLGSFVLQLKKLWMPETPFTKSTNAWREKLLSRAMRFLNEKDPKYNFPRSSMNHYAEAIFNKKMVTPIFSDDRKFEENYMVKSLWINFCLEVWSPFFEALHSATTSMTRKLMGHNPVSLEELMVVSKLGSTFRSPADAMWMKKPSIRDKESLRIPDLWLKEHSYLLDELSKRSISEEPQDHSDISDGENLKPWDV